MVSLACTDHRNGEVGHAYRKGRRMDDEVVVGSHRSEDGEGFDGRIHHDHSNRGDRVGNARDSVLGGYGHAAWDACRSHPLGDNHGALGSGNGRGREEDDPPRVGSIIPKLSRSEKGTRRHFVRLQCMSHGIL